MAKKDRSPSRPYSSRSKAAAFFLGSFVLLFAILSALETRIHHGDWTGPFLVGDLQSPDRTAWPIPVAVQVGSPGYDGQFYLALAMDPFLRTRLANTLDDPAYRARRITWPLAAWSLSGGNPSRAAGSLHFLNLFMMSAGASAFAAQAARGRSSRLWGFAFLLSLGCVVSLSRGLGDGIMVSLLMLGLFFARTNSRIGIAAGATLFALAVLQKETALLAFPAFILVRQNHNRRLRFFAASAALLIPFSWWVYVHFAVTPNDTELMRINFGMPSRGFFEALSAGVTADKGTWRLLKSACFLGIHGVAIGVGIVVGLNHLFRHRGDRIFSGVKLSAALFAGMGLLLAYPIWGEPWAYARTLLPIFALLLWNDFESAEALVTQPRRWTSGRLLMLANSTAGVAFLIKNLILRIP